MKRFLRSPWLWIVVAVIGVLVALQYLVPNGGYKEIETSTMVDNIQSGDVKEITFKDGGNQQIQATLDNGDKVMATWVTGQQRPARQRGPEAGRRGQDREVQRREPQAQPPRPAPRDACCRSR